MRCHSVRSWGAPAFSFHLSVVATEKLVTGRPLAVCFSSGAVPRKPIRVISFLVMLVLLFWAPQSGHEKRRAELPSPSARIFGAGAPKPGGRPKAEAERPGCR